MAKGRMLQKRISKSNKMVALSSDTVRLLYTWLLAHLDINGNFYADPVMVNNLVFTRLGHSVKVVASALDELEANGLIVRYVIDGEQYLNYPDFQEKQPKLQPDREGKPDIPDITPELLQSKSRVTQTQNKIKESKLKENKSKGIFQIPTIQEISNYCAERKNKINPETFYSHYQSNGWMVGKNKMKDWKAAIITWETKEKEYANTNSQGFKAGTNRSYDNNRQLTPGAAEELDQAVADWKRKTALREAGKISG